MNKTHYAFPVAVILALVAIVIYLHSIPKPALTASHPSFTFNNHTYAFTYVASNPQEWESGLMNKTVVNSTFELFVFPRVAVYTFWMKDTYYPLDMIWINGSTVVDIEHAIPCSSYSPSQSNCTVYNTKYPADYVIEADAGFANSTGMKVGDNVNIVS